ncbi:cell wall hydrolase [Paenirhodobacter sp.]|uniref:cell wall hydrolase n=1 Tax=Paenirhodobacter sp. TaxID=1965326 RepID=UPI003B3F7D5A
MSVLKSWTGGAVVLLALAGGLRAEVTVSQSNDPGMAAEAGLVSLLGQERAGLGSVPSARMSAIVAAPKDGQPRRLTAGWLDAQPTVRNDAQVQCLATAVYHEARGEPLAGQQAVAEVILNRVDDAAFPKTVCGVVNQRSGRGCQFSYVCDGRSDKPSNMAAYRQAQKIARAMLDGQPRTLTDGATYFHTTAVKPSWSRRFERTAKIGAHLFYRKPVQTAEN